MMAKMTRTGGKGTIWKPRVVVTNTDPRLFDALFEKTRIGKVTVCGPSGREGRKKCYKWIMTATEAEKALPKLLPWLVLKRRQAELLIEAIQICKANTSHRGQKMDPTAVAERMKRKLEIVEEVRYLNGKKGVKWEQPLSPAVQSARELRARWNSKEN